jgi:hypothetical protein
VLDHLRDTGDNRRIARHRQRRLQVIDGAGRGGRSIDTTAERRPVATIVVHRVIDVSRLVKSVVGDALPAPSQSRRGLTLTAAGFRSQSTILQLKLKGLTMLICEAPGSESTIFTRRARRSLGTIAPIHERSSYVHSCNRQS